MFLPQLRSRLNASHRRSTQRLSGHQSHPCLERLEVRCLLSTVTNASSRLRRRLAAAAPSPIHPQGTVDFQAGLTGTITLTSGPLTIATQFLTITGPGADMITVSGNNARQVFSITAPFTVAISGLTIANGGGNNSGSGSGIANNGRLTITDCIVSDNSSNWR